MEAFKQSYQKVFEIFNRKEFAALVVLVAVMLFAFSGIPAKFGVDVPREQLVAAVQVALVAFVGSMVEGKAKDEYSDAWATLIYSKKFQFVLLTCFVITFNTFFKASQFAMPAELVTQLSQYAVYAIVLVTGIDLYSELKTW